MKTLRACLSLCSSLLFLAGCPGPAPRPDAIDSRDTGRDLGCTTNCDDAITPDVFTDGSLDAGSDTGTPLDVPRVDVPTNGDSGPLTGPCTPVGSGYTLVTEGRFLPRKVFLGTNSTGYVTGTNAQRLGVENAEITVVDAMGMFSARTNVSLMNGAIVEGGSFATDTQDASGLVVLYSANPTQNLDLFARRMMPGNLVVTAPEVRVTNDPQASQAGQIVSTGNGYVVAWRSEDRASNTVELKTLGLDANLALGAVNTLTAGLESFALVSAGGTTEVVYMTSQAGAGTLRAQKLGTNGAAMGAPITIATGARAADSVSATMQGTKLAVLWAADSSTAALHARSLDTGTGTLGAVVDLTIAGPDVSRGGLANDGQGYAVAFRRTSGTTAEVAMVRLDANFAAREGVSSVQTSGSGEGVTIVAGSTVGRYAVGWSDSSGSSSTRAQVQVMSCQ